STKVRGSDEHHYSMTLSQMYSRRLPDSWVAIRFVLFDEDGEQLLDLRTEIRGQSLRNTMVNGRSTNLLP
ncbi:hypothetical protein ANCDUO_18511, partial [Ancylostoma duodenale]